MAFGDVRGTLSGAGGSIPNPASATGSVAVSVGDLVFVVIAQQTNLTGGACTDNLGHTYTATNAGTDAGNVSGRAYYLYVTTAGTLTQIDIVATASANDYSVIAVVFEGAFATSPLDANPANASNDLADPYLCPATGTLAQADELVVSWLALAATASTWTADAPDTVQAQNAASANAHSIIGSRVVAATSSVQPSYDDAADPPGASVLGTSSFKKAAAGDTLMGQAIL